MLKLQYFGYLMWRADSLEKTLMLGKTEDRRRGQWRMRCWVASLTQWTWVSASSGRGQGSLVGYSLRGLKESGTGEWPNNIISWLFQHLLSSPLCFLPFLQECRLISATGDTITEIWRVLSRWRDKRREEETFACPSPCFLPESSAVSSCLSHWKKKRLIEIERVKTIHLRTAAEPRGRVGFPEEVLESLDPLQNR